MCRLPLGGGEFRELAYGIDRMRSVLLFRLVTSVQWRYHLQSVTTGGGELTAASRHKLGLALSPLCPWCTTVVETLTHRFWECPRWSHLRQQWTYGLDSEGIPDLLKIHGLVPLGYQGENSVILCVQAQLLSISLEAMRLEHPNANCDMPIPHPHMLSESFRMARSSTVQTSED